MQVCGASGPGGAESFFLRLVHALHNSPQVEVLPIIRKNSWLHARLKELNIPFVTAAFGGKLDILTRPKIRYHVRRFKPNVIQSWMNRASMFVPRKTNAVTVGRLGGPYDLKYYAGLDWLIGNTPDICRHITRNGWPSARTRHITNFVNLPADGFKILGVQIRESLGIAEHSPVLLIAGRLHASKGIDIAIKALAQLPRHTHLIIAGDGDEKPALQHLAKTLGIALQVHFTGWVNNITPYCASADIFLVPSRKEPLGNVILEAWAHAMPVIASSADGPKLLITHEKNGMIVPTGNEHLLASTIQKVLNSPTLANNLAEQGLMKLHREFSERAIMDDYLAFYREITKA